MLTLILVAMAAGAEQPARPAGLDPELAPPVHLLADGKPLDVEHIGHAAPCVGDFFGDSKPTLLVGQFSGGKMRVYRTTSTGKGLTAGGYEYFKASETFGAVPAG
jgi:hypothetical protein